jgi:hypothetical protein
MRCLIYKYWLRKDLYLLKKRTGVRFYYSVLGFDDIDIILFHFPDKRVTGYAE